MWYVCCDRYNEYNSYCSRSAGSGDSTVCPPCILVANKIDVDYNVSNALIFTYIHCLCTD